MENKEFGIYVHIPFCKQKCLYCDFVSYVNKEELVSKYVETLKEEIKSNVNKIGKQMTTIYIGGGTPSFISSTYIKEILETIKENYEVSNNAEVTIEINPGTVSKEKLEDYKNIGINRLSIGLQSTKNNLLSEIGRIHTYEQFLDTYKLARSVGFNNINVDLMLGLPNQTVAILEESLREVISLKPEHISVYSLILEEGTKLYDLVEKGKLIVPSEESEREMYWKIKEVLEKNEYTHYEISNFSKEGYESKHNLNCWKQCEYIGFGAAAHSYVNGTRYSNTDNIDEYINNFKTSITIHEKQTDIDMQKEYMLLGLRKIDGCKITEFKNKFGENPIYVFRNELDKLVKEELLEVEADNIKLTSKGLDLANVVFEEFI